MTSADRATHRAARLLRCYPRAWRGRYGEEFTELLIADLAERPRSLTRTVDVVRGGMLARLTYAGLAGRTLEPADQLRSSLAALGCCMAVFLAFGVGQWAQLTIDWQWAPPDAPAIALAIKVMSAALLVLAVLAVAAVAPVAWSAGRAMFRPGAHRLGLPALLVLFGAAVLVAGSRHFAQGWPGTGGHPWPGKGLIPAGMASLAWASTLSINSYWAHPDALGAFPASQIAWMVVAPVAMTCLVAGAAKLIRRLQLSPRVLRFEARLAGAAAVAMLAFLGAATCRVLEGDAGPRRLFASAGAIDLVDIVVMAAALAATLAIVRRARGMSEDARAI